MHLLLSLPYVRILYHPVSATLEVGWSHSPTSEQLRWVLQRTLHLTHQLQAQAWIGDLRQLHPLAGADYAWLATTWLPHLAASTVSLLAVVLPALPLAAAQAGEATAQLLPADGPVCTQYFTCPTAARQWTAQLP